MPRRPGAPLVGYHISCPGCGWMLFVMHGDDGQEVIERPEGPTIYPPAICGYCGLEIAVDAGEVTLREVRDAC